MNVLMTADAVGGVWSYALTLARALAPHGVRVTLAAMGPPPGDAQRAAASAVDGLRLVHRPLKLEWMDDPWSDVDRAGDWLLELEDELRPDAVHLNGYAHAALAWRAPTVVVAHSCVLSWWESVRGVPAPDEWSEYRRRVAAGVHAAVTVVAPTRAMLDAVARHYGAPRAARVIPNAADPASFAAQPKEPFVLSAGRLWDEAKNVAAIDRAAAALSWPVYVAGNTRHPDGGRAGFAAARALGPLAPHDLASWMGRASIYALPARYEPFGLSALEAALAGCAPVLGDVASLREVWGDAARYVPPDDDQALARTLTSLIADPAARGALAGRAAARAREYAPRRMAQAYRALYGEMTTLRGAARSGPHAACPASDPPYTTQPTSAGCA